MISQLPVSSPRFGTPASRPTGGGGNGIVKRGRGGMNDMSVVKRW